MIDATNNVSDPEGQHYRDLAAAIQHDWDTNPRWHNVHRPYTAQ
jgi:isocitrate lyase